MCSFLRLPLFNGCITSDKLFRAHHIFHVDFVFCCVSGLCLNFTNFHVVRCKVQINSIFQIAYHWNLWMALNALQWNWLKLFSKANTFSGAMLLAAYFHSWSILWTQIAFDCVASCRCTQLKVNSTERLNDSFGDYERGQSFSSNALNWKLTQIRRKVWLLRNCATKKMFMSYLHETE